LAQGPAPRRQPLLGGAMAPWSGGGGAAAASYGKAEEEAADGEDDDTQVLLRAGVAEAKLCRAAGGEEASLGGQGGFHVVILVAAFAALGGLLFGLDIGYISGVKSMDSFERDVLGGRSITASEDSSVTMIFGVGASIAAFPLIVNFVVDLLGRKGTVVLGGIVFCVGSLLQGLATSMGAMMFGRLVAGMSVGLLSTNVPVYQSEVAPPRHRGMFVSLYQLAVTVGIMLAFLLALALEDVERPVGGWRWVILAQLVPGLLLALGSVFLGESPRWLVSKGRPEDALVVLMSLRGPDDDVRLELAQICREREREDETGKPSVTEFCSGDIFKLVSIGVLLQLLQQLCGMNAFMYDGPVIFGKLFKSAHAGRLFTAVSGCVNILSNFPALFLIDRAGRTILLRWSAAGMALCSAVLATVGTVCFPDHHNGPDHPGGRLLLQPGEEEAGACGDWARWVATGSICLFIFNFGYGWGPVVWTYCAEMFPMKYRTMAVGATTDANWVGNIFVAMLPPLLLHSIGFHTFWIFVGVNLIGLALAAALPETKDRSLEEIQQMFGRFLHGDRSDSRVAPHS